MGLLMAPFFDIILAGVEEHEIGSASGTLNAVQQFGSALGIAILGHVFFHVMKIGPTGPVAGHGRARHAVDPLDRGRAARESPSAPRSCCRRRPEKKRRRTDDTAAAPAPGLIAERALC